MPAASLPEFLESLADAKELLRISAPVDPDLEAAEITRRIAAVNGPALLFERLHQRPGVLVTNLFGTIGRACRAVGVDSRETLIEKMTRIAETGLPKSWLERIKSPSAAPAVERFAPKTVKVGPCQQVVCLGRDVDLRQLPAPRSYPGEAIASITAGLTVAADPRGGRQYGQYPLGILDDKRLALFDDEFGPLRAAREAAAERREHLPVAIVLGGDPLAILLARLPVLGAVDLWSLCGVWRESSPELVAGRTQPVHVPAVAEMIIEGFIDPAAPQVAAGPIAVETGCYHERAACDVIHVTAITRRNHAAFPARVADCRGGDWPVIRDLLAPLLLPSIRPLLPEVVDLAFPAGTGRNQIAVAAIDKQYAGQARKVAGALWGHPELMLTRGLILVDRHVPVGDWNEVMRRVGSNVRAGRDLFVQEGPLDPLAPGDAQRWGLDATAKLPGETDPGQPWPDEAVASDTTIAGVTSRWNELGLKKF